MNVMRGFRASGRLISRENDLIAKRVTVEQKSVRSRSLRLGCHRWRQPAFASDLQIVLSDSMCLGRGMDGVGESNCRTGTCALPAIKYRPDGRTLRHRGVVTARRLASRWGCG